MAIKRRNNRRTSHRPNHQRLYKVVCAGCGKEVRLEVPPPIGKKLFCLDCYKKSGSDQSTIPKKNSQSAV